MDFSLPQDCPDYIFPEFQPSYGLLWCEVYIGCFGQVGNREGGAPATTVSACLELTCGGASESADTSECWLDEARAGSCLEALSVIADDLTNSCPDIEDAWFPSDCGLAIDCADL